MNALCQVEQRARSAAASVEDDGPLGAEGPLNSAVVEGDHGGRGRTERPHDLASAVVIAAIVAVEDQGDQLGIYRDVRLEQAERSARVSQTNQVGAGNEQGGVGGDRPAV